MKYTKTENWDVFLYKNKKGLGYANIFFICFLSFQNLNRETTLKASNGEHMKALEVFTYSIHYLHARALEVIRERTGDQNFAPGDVQWVITVPAIWKPAAKQFMREAAYQVRHSH